MKGRIYKGESAREISFPLGGIGTGCIGLAGNGQMLDMEIYNAPNKGSFADFSHFCIKAEKDGEVVDQRILQGDYPQSHTGAFNGRNFNCYGFGPNRSTMAGFPNFKECEFEGCFPLAKLKLADEHFPGKVTMSAFNPFIPTNDKDSTIPGAFFEFEINNDSADEISYSIALSQANMYCDIAGVHSFEEKGGVKSVYMTNNVHAKTDKEYGDITISTDCEETSHQLYWYRGRWFDNLTTFWKNFNESHHIVNRVYDKADEAADVNLSTRDAATLVAHVTVAAGESKKVRFVISWNMPNAYNYWSETADKSSWKNYYAVLFENSLISGRYAVENFERLYNETELFTETLMSSSMSETALESISANLSTIKSPTCLRLEDGSLYGWEGNHCCEGCCEGSCTHVWSYTYSIPFLFPKLERSMRTIEYTHAMRPDGGMAFRVMLPIGTALSEFRPCVDGQYATVMRVLREFKVSGDVEWLKEIWPNVKRTIEYAWSPENDDKWDLDKDGLMEGRQHHTLDMELFGHNAWLSGLYLGGLKAGAELAEILGDTAAKKEYTEIYEKGVVGLNETLFNGDYYAQIIDLKDKSLLAKYADGVSLQNEDVFAAYWNEEQQEIMYQIADGCELDQTLAQYHANLIGLGDIFDKEKTKKSLESIYKLNFIDNMREHVNPCRLYCLQDEGGLLICNWPEGAKKGFIPLPYSEETQNGYEYAAAIQMMQNGMVEEGLKCVEAIRNRYDGVKRNPWNEFECGSNYARSMATYAMLLTFSGFIYDAGKGIIGFKPIECAEDYRFFWSLDSGWGEIVADKNSVELKVLYGELAVNSYILNNEKEVVSVTVDGKDVSFTRDGVNINLNNKTSVKQSMLIKF